jgi:hypothetical protein
MTHFIDLDETIPPWTAPAPVVIRVHFAGADFDLPLTSLDIGTETSDQKVKRAVATRLLITRDRLDDHVIDRQTDGNLRIRPGRIQTANAPSPGRPSGAFLLRATSSRRPNVRRQAVPS